MLCYKHPFVMESMYGCVYKWPYSASVTAHTALFWLCMVIVARNVAVAMSYNKGAHCYGDVAVVSRFLPTDAMAP